MMRTFLISFLLVVGLVSAATTQSTHDASWRPKAQPASSLVPPGTPAPGATEKAAIAEVLAFEKATEAAVVRGDTAQLERALAPTFLFTHGDGWADGGAPLKVDTKASWIDWVKKQPAPYVYRELDSVQVELHGDVAITVGRYYYLPTSNGPPNHSQVWFERVYAKRNGQWQQLSHRTVKGPLRTTDTVSQSTDEGAVRAVVQKYVDAREQRDPAAIGALFTDDADQFNSAGDWRRGREAIVKGTLQSSQRNSGARSITLKAVRFPAPGLAVADGEYGIGDQRLWTTLLLTKQGETWKIAAIRNSRVENRP
jgi:uncharacterized protein (TIGR02246 family)